MVTMMKIHNNNKGEKWKRYSCENDKEVISKVVSNYTKIIKKNLLPKLLDNIAT